MIRHYVVVPTRLTVRIRHQGEVEAKEGGSSGAGDGEEAVHVVGKPSNGGDAEGWGGRHK